MFVTLTVARLARIGESMDEDAIYAALGQTVAARRKGLKLTQAEIATKVGISRASIANIEAGRQKVLLHQVYGFVQALGLKAITDLIPASPLKSNSIPRPPSVSISGDPVTAAQRPGIDQLIQMALDQQITGGTQ